ncbi:PilZ domain-containing protein [Leptospira meyeri]|nr:PilZ domain-containing protein [Leptospira meyeri]
MNDRRKRLQRPLPILVFGLYFLLLPIFNYFSFAYAHNIRWTYPRLIFDWLHPLELILLILAIPVGIGLLLVKKWGWYLFLVYASLFILFDIVALVQKPIAFNLFAFGQTILGFGAVFYLTRENISTPYLKLYPRGWRYEKRNPIQIPILLNGIECTTIDFSRKGFYVVWSEFLGEPGDTIQVDISGTTIEAGIVRIDPKGLGVAFRNLQPVQIKIFEDIIASKNINLEHSVKLK